MTKTPRIGAIAERGGFEPPVPIRVRQFSKLVVSATHPSFLWVGITPFAKCDAKIVFYICLCKFLGCFLQIKNKVADNSLVINREWVGCMCGVLPFHSAYRILSGFGLFIIGRHVARFLSMREPQ